MYEWVKSIHVLAACVTVTLFVLRFGLDVVGRTGWRETPLRWLPHLNDTVLLTAALLLVWLTGWMPFVHHWLTLKVLLLIGYILTGRFVFREYLPLGRRSLAFALALVQVALIFWLALERPVIVA